MQNLDSDGYDTDKGKAYTSVYERHFSDLRTRPINLLELGVHRGGSLLMWRDYFSAGRIVGVDLAPPDLGQQERIHLFAGDASVPETYAQIERETGIGRFDIIIDDASHYGILTKRAFEVLFERRLAEGGLYVLEDWGTAYRKGWPDGAPLHPPKDIQDKPPYGWRFPSHDYGMAGYLKQLIDGVAYRDVVAGGGRMYPLPIQSISVYFGLAVIHKSV